MGHNSWINKVKQIEHTQRDATARGLEADAVAIVETRRSARCTMP